MIKNLKVGDKDITLVGTAHVFKRSILEVREVIQSENPDFVAIELDRERYFSFKGGQKASFMERVKEGGLKFALFGGMLSMVQEELGEEFGVLPGSDMISAVEEGEKTGAKVFFIDRNVTITLSRMIKFMTFKEKIKTLLGIVLSFTPLKGEIPVSTFNEEFIEKMLADFKKFSPNAYRVLIEERNIFMARMIRSLLENEVGPCKIVVVLGAGHMNGVLSILKGGYTIEK
ncbi:MAG: TraB/GumN family protein [Candidatus Methanofastidiosia archaeon]